ncbi:MAG: quinate 5-dehydrogenase [Caldisericia bacterium]
MKKILSISLGSSKRDKKVNVNILGEDFEIQRIGTDGDIQKMIELFKDYDEKVDAFGLGGTDFYIRIGNKKVTLKEVGKVIKFTKSLKSPVCDGQYIRERFGFEDRAIQYLKEIGYIKDNTKVLIPSGVSRYNLVLGFKKANCKILYGDLMFSLGIPIPIYSFKTFLFLASIIVPFVKYLPHHMLYPTGESQEKIEPKFEKYYKWADLIAGDFIYIKKHMPDDLSGKIIFTNTTTTKDRKLLKERNVKLIVTTTPEFEGRTFGTNVIEAIICAYYGKKVIEISESEYQSFLKEFKVDKPTIYEF